MKRISPVFLIAILPISGCITQIEREESAWNNDEDKAIALLAGMALISSATKGSEDEIHFNNETTITPEDSKVIEELKCYYAENEKWMENPMEVGKYVTIEEVEMIVQEGSLFCTILRQNQTRVVFRIHKDLSVTYSTLPNIFYKALSESLQTKQKTEPEYTFWDAFFDMLPNAFSIVQATQSNK